MNMIKKRLSSLLLAIVMVLGMLPVGTLAAEPLPSNDFLSIDQLYVQGGEVKLVVSLTENAPANPPGLLCTIMSVNDALYVDPDVLHGFTEDAGGGVHGATAPNEGVQYDDGYAYAFSNVGFEDGKTHTLAMNYGSKNPGGVTVKKLPKYAIPEGSVEKDYIYEYKLILFHYTGPADSTIVDTIYVNAEGNSVGKYAKPAEKTDTTISASASSGEYNAAGMTFPSVALSAGNSKVDAKYFTVAWAAAATGGGTIVNDAPTTVGAYTATVELTADGAKLYNLPSNNTVTYTVNPISINELTLTNVPTAPVLGGSIAAISPQIKAGDKVEIVNHSWAGGTTTWVSGNTPSIVLTIDPVTNHAFKTDWKAADIKGELNGATPTVALKDGTLTVTLTWSKLTATPVPGVTNLKAVQDKTTTGGVTVTFNEPADTSKISEYTVTLNDGKTDVVKTVSKTANSTAQTVTFDLSEVTAGSSYTVKVTSVAANPVANESKDVTLASKVTVAKAAVTVTATPAINEIVGYEGTPTTVVTVKNASTGVVAKGITLSALPEGFTCANWPGAAIDVAPGAETKYTVTMDNGLVAKDYSFDVTASGGNLTAAVTGKVTAKVVNPAAIEAITLTAPAQPKIGDTIADAKVSVKSATTMGTVSNVKWNATTGEKWADGNTPTITLTLTAPTGKIYQDGMTITVGKDATATVTKGKGTKEVEITLTYAKLEAVPVSVEVISPADLTYGYTQAGKATVRVANTGSAPAKVKMGAMDNTTDFTVSSWETGEVTIAVDAHRDFTVTLKTGKTAADYTVDFALTPSEGTKIADGSSATGTLTQTVKVADVLLSVDKFEVAGKAGGTITAYVIPKVDDKLLTEDITSGLEVVVPTPASVIEKAELGAFEAGKGYPLTIKIADNALADAEETLKVTMTGVAGKFAAEGETGVTVTVTDKTPVEFALSKTEADFNAKDQSVTFTSIKKTEDGSNVVLKEDEDYTILYDGEATKPKDAGTYTVSMKMLKPDSEYIAGSTKNFTIKPVQAVASLSTTAIKAAGHKLGEYFTGFESLTGASHTVTGAENQFKGVAGDETLMAGTFGITSVGDDFDTEVVKGASYSWTFVPDSANYKEISGNVTPWAASSGGGGGGGGGGSSVTKYTVTYDVGEHGKLTDGKSTERVEKNSTPAKVPTVTANEGWTFLGWTLKGTDELVKPEETKIASVTTFVAKYEEKATLGFDKGLIGPFVQGYDQDHFGPDRSITRNEVAVILARVINLKMESGVDYFISQFPDVDQDSWYTQSIGYLADLGVISGNSDGTFGGDRNITREEFVTMVMRIDGLVEGENPFPDVDASNWALEYIVAAVDKGYVNGMEDGTFRPKENITRASAIKIINGVLGLKDIEGDMMFIDVPTDHWAYDEIIKASVGRSAATTEDK